MATFNHDPGTIMPGGSWKISTGYFPGVLAQTGHSRITDPTYRSSYNLSQSGCAVALNRVFTKALFRAVQAIKYPDIYSGFGVTAGGCSVGEYQLIDDFTVPDTEEKKAAVLAAPVALCIYSPSDGGFFAGVAADKDAKVFPPVTAKHADDVLNDAAYMTYAMLGHLLQDTELSDTLNAMADNYEDYLNDDNSAGSAEFRRLMYVANDNIYRRLNTNNQDGSPMVYTAVGGTATLREPQILSGKYTAVEVHGKLTFFSEDKAAKSSSSHSAKNINDMRGMYAIPGIEYTEEEKRLIPVMPDSTVVTEEAIQIATVIRDSTSLKHPKRNFCLYGPSGLGKTTIAQQVAVLLGMPYLIQGCNSDMDAMDLVVQAVPYSPVDSLTGETEAFPSAMDIAMDPVSSYRRICNVEKADATEADCLKAIALALGSKKDDSSNANRVRYERSNVLKGLTKPYFIEMQEPSTIQKQGALTVLNSMMDDCRQITLPDGTTVMRDPNAILMMTTNLGYEGTRDMNQSVLSRCRKIHIDYPEKSKIVAFLLKVTEIKDKKVLGTMVDVFNKIRRLCEDNGITQGSCGYRELIDWADEAYLNGMELYDSCKRTMVISAAVHNQDDFDEIEDVCLKPLIKSV